MSNYRMAEYERLLELKGKQPLTDKEQRALNTLHSEYELEYLSDDKPRDCPDI